MKKPNRMARHTLVLGGGVAGMAAALSLAKAGRPVTLLEARDRLGGRVLSAGQLTGGPSLELGAEFIHGGSAALTRALKEASITAVTVVEDMWQVNEGEFQRKDHYWEEIASIAAKMPAKKSISVSEFMRTNQDIPEPVKIRITRYLESFNAGPANKMSARAVHADAGGTEGDQKRPKQGYGPLIVWYEGELARHGVRVELGQVAKEVSWSPGSVAVKTHDSIHFGDTLVITLPLGLLKAKTVRFRPALRDKDALVRGMGWGEVARITLRFRAGLWRSTLVPSLLRKNGKANFGFLNTEDAAFPVWWVPNPAKPVLVGWSGGPHASRLNKLPSERWERIALQSLATLFQTTPARLRKMLIQSWAHNWVQDEFTRGAYSFAATGAEDAGAELAKPIAETLFFAGEATAEELGTVHGAIDSGIHAARAILGR